MALCYKCLGELLVVLAALAAIFFAYFKWTYQYWQRKNLNYLEPRIPWGNSVSPFRRREQIGFRLKRHYETMKSKGWKHGGLFLFTSPTYMPIELEYVKNIMTKDFQHFVDRGVFYNEKDDPLSGHLFNLGGSKWRNLRTKLTPTFTSGKMKMMFHTLIECVPFLLQKIESDRVTNTPIDIKEVLGCFTTDIIGSVAFGLDCNTFKEENSPFREYGRKVFTAKPLQIAKMIFAMIFPELAKSLKLVITSKDVTNFFMKVVKDTIDYRERNKITRNDFMQLLIDMKNKSDGEALTIEEVAAQSFVFFIAGFETSSTTMTFALYELAKRPDLQERVRKEVDAVLEKHDGKMIYDAIHDMKYMDQVVDETLRMYPPVTLLIRKCVKDYKIPNEDLTIEKGTSVLIPILAIHRDPEYYPEPEKFDPERFSAKIKEGRHQHAHLPFGQGPRMCIGMRFGLMQTKVGLASLLKDFKFALSSKTQQPLTVKVHSFVLAAEGNIWLNAEKR